MNQSYVIFSREISFFSLLFEVLDSVGCCFTHDRQTLSLLHIVVTNVSQRLSAIIHYIECQGMTKDVIHAITSQQPMLAVYDFLSKHICRSRPNFPKSWNVYRALSLTTRHTVLQNNESYCEMIHISLTRITRGSLQLW